MLKYSLQNSNIQNARILNLNPVVFQMFASFLFLNSVDGEKKFPGRWKSTFDFRHPNLNCTQDNHSFTPVGTEINISFKHQSFISWTGINFCRGLCCLVRYLSLPPRRVTNSHILMGEQAIFLIQSVALANRIMLLKVAVCGKVGLCSTSQPH